MTAIRTRYTLPFALALAAALNPCDAHAQVAYTYTTIDVPGAGIEAWGINNAGQIVGQLSDMTGIHGFVRSAAGGVTTYDVPASVLPNVVYTVGFGINSVGQIAGTAGNTSNVSQGFVRSSGGVITAVGPANGNVQGINDAGQMVGYVGSGSNVVGLLLNGSSTTTFSVPGSNNTYAFGINSAGVIAGQWDSGGVGYHGFLRTAVGNYTTFDYPGATSTYPFGMNDAGDTVGGLERPGFPPSGFLRTATGSFSVISFPGSDGTEVTGINSLGQIVGVYSDATGGHSFLATPVPEPTSLAFLGAAGSATIWRRRRSLPRSLIAALGAAMLATGAQAQIIYNYALRADNTGPLSLLQHPLINDGGSVAFLSTLDAGGSGIYTVSAGGSPLQAVGSGATFSSFGFAANNGFNTTGAVAFQAGLTAGSSGVFTAAGGSPVTVAQTGSGFIGFGQPALNSAGTVAFAGFVGAGQNRIYTSTAGGAPVQVVGPDTTFTGGFGQNLALSNSGTVAFSGTRTAGGQGIYRLPAGGTPAEFANTDGPISNFLNGSVAINSTGSVAFTAALDAGGTGLLLSPAGGSLTQVADTSGQFSALVLGGLNFSGTLAFVGDLTAGGRAVYLFPPGGSLTRIIGNGDALDGSTITGLTFPFASINDAGQIAFAASLADGRQGVFVGTPVPEPTSLALIAVGGLGALRRRRRGCLTRRIADQTQIRTAFCPTALSQERNAMKSMIWLCIAISALAGTNPSYAGVITWASPANISGDADVSTTGTLVGAVHIGDLGIVATTVNGVTFTPFTISSANGSNPITDPSGRFTLSGAAVNGTNAYGSLAAPFSTLSSSYQSLLNGGDFGAGNSLQVLTINNLNPGTTYQFQFWSNDSRGIFHTIVNATAGNTVAVDANVEGNTAGGIGQFAIGTFTADATMQVIDFQGAPGGGTSENAFELRILTVPEPGSGLLVLAALGGYVIRRRRGH